eukprot:TRINITY_DN24034_c0_g1_i1.p1 TRINITY_DN24034_c0_g1~~TRINITY_DN24034_c0_g1_i1.p1  ORF type:complete len:241 (+),score=22.79 TRINITY_DN24034_c0_g1_i1:194-916(+)
MYPSHAHGSMTPGMHSHVGGSHVHEAVPHTTMRTGVGYTQHTTGVQHQVVGYRPILHSQTRRIGLGKPYGKLHRAPWHKKKNITVTTTHVDQQPILAPVPQTHVDAHPVAVAETHFDERQVETTAWMPVEEHVVGSVHHDHHAHAHAPHAHSHTHVDQHMHMTPPTLVETTSDYHAHGGHHADFAHTGPPPSPRGAVVGGCDGYSPISVGPATAFSAGGGVPPPPPVEEYGSYAAQPAYV